ncbi:MAG: terminase family protein [Bacteroidia bacterium]|nr:terminase family protein [Bacteroidia bacterium]
MSTYDGPWKPQPGPQTEAIRKAWVDEILYGGAAGGGKSSWLLGDFAQDVPRPGGENWHGILFRRTYGQLEDLIQQSLDLYPKWFDPENKGLVKWMAGEKTWRWANGATLKMRYAEHEDDWIQYQGHSYCWIGFDELTSWPTPTIYLRMKARLRSGDPRHKYRRIRATANPGGPGHVWVMNYFRIAEYPNGGTVLHDPVSGMKRLYIKARVTDNKKLLLADPLYPKRLEALGTPELVRAWLEGDWDVVQGAYFTEFDPRKHVITYPLIPPYWTKFRAMDWGAAAPFAVLWIAVSDGQPTLCGRVFPKGALIVYREWYGARQGINKDGNLTGNVGLKLSAEEVAFGILERDNGETLDDAVIDPAAFIQNGGISIAEAMARATDGKLMFRKGDNKRIPGWQSIRDRLRGGVEGPMLYIAETCENLIRQLKTAQHDEQKPEDVDTDIEDHAIDALRYGCMARPWVSEERKGASAVPVGLTLGELLEYHDLYMAQRRRYA